MASFNHIIMNSVSPVVLRLISPSSKTSRLDEAKKVLTALRNAGASLISLQSHLVTYVDFKPALCKNPDDRQRYCNLLLWITDAAATQDGTVPLRQIGGCGENGHDELDFSVLRIEIGPRLNFKTSFCTNALSIMAALHLNAVERIERSRIYELRFDRQLKAAAFKEIKTQFLEHYMDAVLECEYTAPITSFAVDIPRQPIKEIDVMTQGKEALISANKELSLGFDEDDLEYYFQLFASKLHRNPTNAECLDLAQSNSEHSRHWFFNGRMTIDGKEMPRSLFQMVKDTQNYSNPNNVIKFSDNSSAIKGFEIRKFQPVVAGEPAQFIAAEGERHIIFTAETHNFPTAVEPFSGATTGTGGRIRDVHATGRGAHVIAGTAGYSFGNCHIPGFSAVWENDTDQFPGNFAHPLKVIIEASNGASDYGNKFGEPVICGFARSFGARINGGERREWIKPIMFSGGIGSIDAEWITKFKPATGMDVVKIGGPVYRIGLGGGAASSTVVQGSNNAAVDFNAVQRGDAEMEQKLNRVIRGCIESKDNPIVSIHDQGAGGNANVLKEIVEPAGAIIRADSFTLGDETVSIHELWVAEYQESVAVLVPKDQIHAVKQIAQRERCPVDVVGEITGSGNIILEDFASYDESAPPSIKPINLHLDLVLGNVPKKHYELERMPEILSRSDGIPVSRSDFLETVRQVLQLPSVASKRYLTNKVDRSVTGLVAQQQCVGPFHTPLADVAVIALSHFDTVGSATAIGEQPIKMLFDVKRGARLTVVEALTNLMFAKISSLKDVKCSGNWMWPAKLPGEGAALYDACEAMCSVMRDFGIAIDGGKDSLSMAAKCYDEVIKAPGTLVISAYAPCPDIRKKVTPEFKAPNGRGAILWVDLSNGQRRLQGSAFTQVHNAYDMYDEVPDLESAEDFVTAFNITQQLIDDELLTAGHDISDGGLMVCLLEMAIAGNVVFDVKVPVSKNYECEPESVLFSEEVGWVLEADFLNSLRIQNAFRAAGITCQLVGHTHATLTLARDLNGKDVYPPFVSLNERLVYGADRRGIAGIRLQWEEFSQQIEMLQCDPECADAQKEWLATSACPSFHVNFMSDFDLSDVDFFRNLTLITPAHRVAVMREEGSNGDREMAVAFHIAGFEVWDVTVQDLLDQRITLDMFRGIAFVGGFSYADVFGSAKGWAAVLASNDITRTQLERFFQRSDSFSLGVCNGCQLLALLGIVGSTAPVKFGIENAKAVLKHNRSGRFESRFSTVRIENTSAIMLKNMIGTQIGVWVAHGEGRFEVEEDVGHLSQQGCIAVRYVDDTGRPAETYPWNPNGSPFGIAGMCSIDGRHLAMMPHPERSILTWQWPWRPDTYSWPKNAILSPWTQMFKTAYDWCEFDRYG
ncbi:phosphoribosylformylglycinamidine synthase-like [Paramacrobiotus metropolitanus]|uniref:phosphoribosylformylglycinamidine synthase-like n=1 Tax=Paramacrobiotus metropolitanus TaxID=2943436 RepID=UPI002445A68F|nr:phosphoribosylformylglycinamidine synthase-like [Paramacrobiotus metropolitanus]